MIEDREDWMKEVKAHCERCSDDEEESTGVQVERIKEHREWEALGRRGKENRRRHGGQRGKCFDWCS